MGLSMIPLLPLTWLMSMIGLEAQAGALANGFMEIVLAIVRFLNWGF